MLVLTQKFIVDFLWWKQKKKILIFCPLIMGKMLCYSILFFFFLSIRLLFFFTDFTMYAQRTLIMTVNQVTVLRLVLYYNNLYMHCYTVANRIPRNDLENSIFLRFYSLSYRSKAVGVSFFHKTHIKMLVKMAARVSIHFHWMFFFFPSFFYFCMSKLRLTRSVIAFCVPRDL